MEKPAFASTSASCARTREGRAIVPINRGLMAALQTAKDAALSNHVVKYAGQRVHTIRHSTAVAKVSSGVPIEKVAQYLGHSNTAIAYSTYGRFAPEHLADAAEVLELAKLKIGALGSLN